MTDKSIVAAMLTADGEEKLFSKLPTLTVRCMDNATDVLFDFHDGINVEWKGNQLLASAQFRYDDAKPKEVSLTDSQGVSTTYFSRNPKTDMQNFESHSKLLVGYVAVLGGKTVYTTFDLTGAKEALKPVREACKK